MFSLQRNVNCLDSNVFYKTWELNLKYAVIREKEEYNPKVNTLWPHMSKNDCQKLWKVINYRDKHTNSNGNDSIDGK